MYVIVSVLTGYWFRHFNPETKATAWTSLRFLAVKFHTRDEAALILSQFDELTRAWSRVEKL